jgi:hypothetical protein
MYDPQTSQPDPLHPSQTAPPPQNPKKNHAPILLILILVLLCLSGFLFVQNDKLRSQLATKTVSATPTPAVYVPDTITPTVDPTDGWKTYTNDKLAFSVKHPTEWTATEYPTSVSFNTGIQNTNKKTNYVFQVMLEDEKIYNEWKNYPTTKNLGTETINGITYTKYTVEDLYTSLSYITAHTGKLYRLMVYPYDPVPLPETANIPIPQILSTFAFAGPNPSGTESDLKTYVNTTYGFRFDYPKTLMTEVLAAHGQNEADSTSRNFFVYAVGSSDRYDERYVNFEITDVEPSYQGTITQTSISGLSAKKIVMPEIAFEIYSVKLASGKFLEIYVSNAVARRDIANRILASLTFTQ